MMVTKNQEQRPRIKGGKNKKEKCCVINNKESSPIFKVLRDQETKKVIQKNM